MDNEAKQEVDLSLIIACYNEEPHLYQNLERVFTFLDQTKFSVEYIIVDDCSVDNTREVIRTIVDNNPERSISTIFHEKNAGRGKTVTDGFYKAKGKIVGFIDIDLEVSEAYIVPCVNEILNGCDVVCASRIYKFSIAVLIRHILSRGYAFLMRTLLQTSLKDTESGYKFFRREFVLSVLPDITATGWFWDTEIMVLSQKKGGNIVELPCLFLKDPKKKSTVRLVRDSFDYFQQLIRFRSRLALRPPSA